MTKLSLRLCPEYDAELIHFLENLKKGKMSREIRKIIRVGMKVLNSKPSAVIK